MTREDIRLMLQHGIDEYTAYDLAVTVLDLRMAGYTDEAEEIDCQQREDVRELGVELGLDEEDINELLEEYDGYIR